MFELYTDRMRLVQPDLGLLAAHLRSPVLLGRCLGARVLTSWPPPTLEGVEQDFMNIGMVDPNQLPWLGWYWVANADESTAATLVGLGGFKGAPGSSGVVEIGYAVLAECWCRGYATEAVSALTRWALEQDGVRKVIATCLPTNYASKRVLEKAGFELVGCDGEGLDLYERSSVAHER